MSFLSSGIHWALLACCRVTAAAPLSGAVYILWAATEHESPQRLRHWFAAQEGRRPYLVRTFLNVAGEPAIWLHRLEAGGAGH